MNNITFQTNKGLFLCILGLLLAFIANFTGHLSDLSFVIVGIISVFITGQGVERGSAFLAASKDPNCDTANVIHKTFGNQVDTQLVSLNDILSDLKTAFEDITDYVEGSEKAIDDSEDDN